MARNLASVFAKPFRSPTSCASSNWESNGCSPKKVRYCYFDDFRMPNAYSSRQCSLANAARRSPRFSSCALAFTLQGYPRNNIRVQALLNAIYYTLPHDQAKVKAALRRARAHLKDIRTWQSPSPPEAGSPLAYTFDPAIIRRLTSVMPIRLVELPTQEQTLRDVEAMISGIEEACLLNESTSIPAVKVRAEIGLSMQV